MSEKYKNKYRVKSHRLKGYEYSKEGAYFITICTKNHKIEFGKIANGKIQLSENGKIVNDIWSEIPNKYPFIILDEFIVMPNHIHGILIINHLNNNEETRFIASKNQNIVSQNDTNIGDTINRASSGTIDNSKSCKNKQIGGITGKYNPMLQNNISRVIRWYKGRVSFEIHKIHSGFTWQSNYYDNIIRNEKQFQTIKYYLRNNPINWNKDKFHI